jgi:hypothetical protein
MASLRGRRTDEGDARLLTRAGQGRIFGKKAVAGMDGVYVFFFRQRNDSGDVQIGFHGPFAGADLVGLVGLKAMQGEAILLGINGYRAQSKLVRGAEDANGDLAAIGGEKFSNGLGLLHLWSGQSIARNSTLFHKRRATGLRFFQCGIQRKFMRIDKSGGRRDFGGLGKRNHVL